MKDLENLKKDINGIFGRVTGKEVYGDDSIDFFDEDGIVILSVIKNEKSLTVIIPEKDSSYEIETIEELDGEDFNK